jgi:hypothetical protein
MTDLTTQYEAALAKAAEYDLLGCLSVDDEKRMECRARARFYHDLVDELQALMASSQTAHLSRSH